MDTQQNLTNWIRRNSLKIITSAFLFAFTGLILLLLIADIAYMIQWKVSIREVGRIISSDEVLHAFFLSVTTSLTTLLLVIVTSIPVGYALSRYRFWGHSFFDTFVDIPIVLPPIVLGISLLAFFGTETGSAIKTHINAFCESTHYYLGFLPRLIKNTGLGYHVHHFWNNTDPGIDGVMGVVLCQYLVSISYCIRAVKASFTNVDHNYEDVALTLGCSDIEAFRRVTLPLAKNGLVAGGIMAWARAIGVFGPLMVFIGTSRRVQVMPTAMWLQLNIGNIEEALVISLVTMFIAAIAFGVVHKLAPGRQWS